MVVVDIVTISTRGTFLPSDRAWKLYTSENSKFTPVGPCFSFLAY